MVALSFARQILAGNTFGGLVMPAIRLKREIPAHFELARQQGRGPMAVFLPSKGREGASLLRIHNMAVALRSLGWRTLVVPWRLNLSQRRRLISAADPDVLVMQGVRHALNRPELYPGQPIVFDIDDADFHLPHLADPVGQAMAGVDAVLAGSEYIAGWCREAGAGETHVVWSGTPASKRHRPSQHGRPPLLAWPQTRPMTYLREAAFVREVTARIAERRPGVRLRLFDRQHGDDPGFAISFATQGLQVEWIRQCRYDRYLAAFDDVALCLAPLSAETPFSRGKSFGKVLACLDSKVPVIASDTGEHAAFFEPHTGIVANDPDVWVSAALALLEDPVLRQRMADAAFEAFQRELSLEKAARKVDMVLRKTISKKTA